VAERRSGHHPGNLRKVISETNDLLGIRLIEADTEGDAAAIAPGVPVELDVRTIREVTERASSPEISDLGEVVAAAELCRDGFPARHSAWEPGDARLPLMTRARILSTSSGSMMTARIFIGAPQCS
jgi:hypothetical protein